MADGITPELPLDFGPEGDFELIRTYPELIRQNLKNLLLTIPGERVFDSNFGVGIQTFLFEQNLPSTYSSIESRVYSQVSEYMPFLTIESFSVESNLENENFINVRISYVIEPLELGDVLVLGLNENSDILTL